MSHLSKSAPQRYFYHSFPRRRGDDEVGKGLHILGSIVKSGLLLCPGTTSWQEPLSDGTLSSTWSVMQIRACFTELAPSELGEHSKRFGGFALEFDVQTLRKLGAIPVFYLPLASTSSDGLECLAAVLVARAGEIQRVLSRLADWEKQVAGSSQASPELNLLLEGLMSGCQPASALRNAFKFLSSFFCPTEALAGDLMSYYREREWRIVADILQHGVDLTREPDQDEIDSLLQLDEEFFAKEVEFPSGARRRRADGCKYFGSLNGIPFLDYARRIIVPREALGDARLMLGDNHAQVGIVSTEDLMNNPPHPGGILRADYLEPLGLTATDAAEALGVTHKTLTAILDERAGIRPAMAHRLSKALGTSPELWINLQTQYDLWQTRQIDLAGVKRLVSA